MTQMKCRQASGNLSFCLIRQHYSTCPIQCQLSIFSYDTSTTNLLAPFPPLLSISHQSNGIYHHFKVPYLQPSTYLSLKGDLPAFKQTAIYQQWKQDPIPIFCCSVLCVSAYNSTYLNCWDIFKCLNEVFLIHSTCSLFACWQTTKKPFQSSYQQQNQLRNHQLSIPAPNWDKVNYRHNLRVLQM